MTQSKNSSNCGFRQLHCRKRLCLLKGCGCWFRPQYGLSRYCSGECRAAARRWSARRAQERYRKSRRGKDKRRRQSRVYRNRRKEQKQVCVRKEDLEDSEGDHKKKNCPGILCARPGCYERVIVSSRSPLKKYCSCACRRAFRRVLEREKRWKQRLSELLEAVCSRVPIPAI